MATRKSVKRKLNEKIERVSGYQNVVPGRVGASPTVIETGIPGLIYVRIENSGQVVTAINAIVPAEYNHPVLLARSKANRKLWEVVASRQAYSVPVNRDIRYHHTQHEHPNPDTVWVRADQFLPFLVLPDTGFTVKIFGGVVTLGGTRYLVNNQSLDLSSLVPTAGAVWVLIEVDSTGAIDTVVSTEVDAKELLLPADIPMPGFGAWEICAVRLYVGQESLRRDTINDFVDLRFGRGLDSGSGSGDMTKAVYDTDDDGIVNAAALWREYPIEGGVTPTNFQVPSWDEGDEEFKLRAHTRHTGTAPATNEIPVYADTTGGALGNSGKSVADFILHSLATAANDFLVASGSGAFVKKTLAETITILRTSLDSIFAPLAKGVTNGDSHNHVDGDGAALNYSAVLFTFLNNGTIPASTTHHTCPGKDVTDTTTNNMPWSEGGVLSYLTYRIAGAGQPASGSLVLTLVINNVDTALVVTIPAGSPGGSYSDTTHSVDLVSGDNVRWKIQNNATAASASQTGITMKLTKQTT